MQGFVSNSIVEMYNSTLRRGLKSSDAEMDFFFFFF